MLADMDAWAEGRPGLTIVVPSFGPVASTPVAVPAPSRRQVWKWAIGGAGLVAAAGTGYLTWERGRWTASPTHKPVLVLLTDFTNNTGDPVFNSTLEQMFTTALEGASFINTYNRGEARRVALQLQPGATKLDGTMARLVAKREAIHYVIEGSVDALSRGYRLTIGVVEANNGKSIFSQSLEIPNKESVAGAVSKLAAQSRRALGDDTDESIQIAAAETYTAANLESANNFAQGQELLWAGKWDDAAEKYLKAIDFDPNFGRAYASLAAVNANKGDRQTAEKYYKQAMEKIDRMSDREKYRSRGVYYLMIRNHSKAIEEFTALLKQYPGDTAGLSNVAMAYHLKRDMKEAVKQSQKAIDLYPSYLLPRHNLAVYARYAGDFATAEREERRVLQVNPSYLMALAGVALSQLARGATAEAAGTYRSMEKISPRGASYCAMGLADFALYEGRVKDASEILEKGLAADLENKNQGAAAKKLVTLASAYAAQKQAGRAADAVRQGLETGKSEMVRLTGALVLAGLGQDVKAREIAAEFASKLEPDPQSYSKLIEGELELKRGRAAQAVKLFSDAQQLSDTWLARYGRGRAYLEAGAFTEAYSDLDLCVKRHGETTEVFLDDVATYHLMPPCYYYLGRAQEGLSSDAAVESYKKYIAIRQNGDADPLLADARRRIQKRG